VGLQLDRGDTKPQTCSTLMFADMSLFFHQTVGFVSPAKPEVESSQFAIAFNASPKLPCHSQLHIGDTRAPIIRGRCCGYSHALVLRRRSTHHSQVWDTILPARSPTLHCRGAIRIAAPRLRSPASTSAIGSQGSEGSQHISTASSSATAPQGAGKRAVRPWPASPLAFPPPSRASPVFCRKRTE
jgi:hypothetical protein